MSQVKISGDVSGTGTLTVAAPNTNSNFTLTLPATTAPILAGSGITLSASAPANTLVTDASGNVGIGTASPANYANYRNLAISGTTGGNIDMLSGSTKVGNLFNDGTNFYAYNLIAGSLVFGTNNAEKARLDSSGNLGLGVTPSASTIPQFEGGANFLLVGRGNVYVGNNVTFNSSFKYISTAAAAQYNISGAEHRFLIAPSGTAGNAISFTQAMTLDSSGNLLVGTTNTTPSSSNVVGCSVNSTGFIHVTGNATSAIDCNRTNNGIVQAFRRGGTIVGDVAVTTTTTTFNSTSDYRLKTVIGPVANAGQRIDALQPVEYTWNASGERTRGFLAHQFQEVYAGSVSGTKDAVDAEGKPVYQAMQASTSEVIADLVAEIKSLRQRLSALEQT